jgi:hypothetical protein
MCPIGTAAVTGKYFYSIRRYDYEQLVDLATEVGLN